MRKRLLPIAFVGTCVIFTSILSCTKLDTTTLGQDLIPEVDNIHTFADTIDINDGMIASQFDFNPDTTKVLYNEAFAVGHIETDPLFGKTDAAIYLQLKPAFYPFYFGNAGDTTRNSGTGPVLPNVGLDSMFLCLSYTAVYGDSMTPIDLEVHQVVDNAFRDTVGRDFDVNYQPASLGPVIGSVTVDVRDLKNQVIFAHGKDSSTNQIRIPITDDAFRNALYNNDSSALTNGAFQNDSLFRRNYNGFAITQKAGGSGNALLYVNLTDPTTRLEVHYFKKGSAATRDTTYTSFSLYPTVTGYGQPSNTGNFIKRNRAGSPSASGDPNYVFLQTGGPGTYAKISIPALATMPNRIIHRATLMVQSVPNPPSDETFLPPGYLYLDLQDTSSSTPKWKPVYYDLNTTSPYDPDFKNGLPFFPISGVDPTSFGGNVKYKPDASNNRIAYYDINITRYVQQVVTKQTPNYPMRLWPAYSIMYPQYSTEVIPFYNRVANGRVRLASPSYSTDTTRRMKLVIIYSNIP